MIKKIEWKEDYSIGIRDIDDQHQNLIAIVNRLNADMDKATLEAELMNLYRHTRIHFQSEEAIMRDIGYPDYKAHQEIHNKLLDQLNENVRVIVNDPSKKPAFLTFMSEWILVHVAQQDKKIAEFLSF